MIKIKIKITIKITIRTGRFFRTKTLTCIKAGKIRCARLSAWLNNL